MAYLVCMAYFMGVLDLLLDLLETPPGPSFRKGSDVLAVQRLDGTMLVGQNTRLTVA